MNKVLSLQYEPRINNREKNFEIVLELIEKNGSKDLDLIVLPEFFSTGISHNGFLEFAENEKEPYAIEFCSSVAVKFNTNLCAGTIIEKDGKNLYNTSYVFDRSGQIVSKYRKIHLFSYLGGCEGEIITKGEEPVVCDLDFAKLGLGICFDIRFPLHFNKLIKMGAEVIACPNAWCVPSNFDKKVLDIKKEEMKAFCISRASENLVYFISSSFSGSLGSGLVSSASSIVISPEAEILSVAKNQNEAIEAFIDLEKVREYKQTFPVYKID